MKRAPRALAEGEAEFQFRGGLVNLVHDDGVATRDEIVGEPRRAIPVVTMTTFPLRSFPASPRARD